MFRIYAIGFVSLCMVASFGYLYYRNGVLEEDNTRLGMALQTSQESLAKVEEEKNRLEEVAVNKDKRDRANRRKMKQLEAKLSEAFNNVTKEEDPNNFLDWHIPDSIIDRL